MPTHIDRMLTDVTVEPEPETEAGSSGADARWEDAERIARMVEQSKQMKLRTRAEGFDD